MYLHISILTGVSVVSLSELSILLRQIFVLSKNTWPLTWGPLNHLWSNFISFLIAYGLSVLGRRGSNLAFHMLPVIDHLDYSWRFLPLLKSWKMLSVPGVSLFSLVQRGSKPDGSMEWLMYPLLRWLLVAKRALRNSTFHWFYGFLHLGT